jgi:hypothetical protein
MTAQPRKRLRKGRVLAVGGLAAIAAALWYFLRFGGFGVGGGDDGSEGKASRDAAVIADAAPAGATFDAAPAGPCRLVLNAEGLSLDGRIVRIDDAAATCKARGRAELVVAGDAPVGKVEQTKAALSAAGVAVDEIHKEP